MTEKESSFRISVCLSRFFDDVRARCYMSVQGRRRVVWLQRRLRRMYALPRNVCLLSRGHLLPPDELLALLRPDDPVEVMPLPAGCNWICNDNHTTIATDSPEMQLAVQQERKKQKRGKKKVIATETNYDDTSRAMECEVGCESGVKSKCDIPNDLVPNTEQTSSEDSKLDQVKQNALLMLQLFEETSVLQSTDLGLSKTISEKRVRRRARRRRPQIKPAAVAIAVTKSEFSPSLELQYNTSGLLHTPSPPLTFPAAAAPAPALVVASPTAALVASPTAALVVASPTAAASIEAAATAVVVRNDSATPRAARLVRPLDEPCGKPGSLIALPAGI